MSGNRELQLSKTRWLILGIIAVLALAAASVYSFQAYQRYQLRTSGASAATISESLPTQNQVLFRNTATGTGYGMLAAVDMNDPSGARTLTQTACDRVYAAAGLVSCLRTVRGVPTTFETDILELDGQILDTAPLPGVPSRTRVSPGGLVATTAFVTGHSYATNSFSTETTIRGADGTDYGNLENYTMTVDGQELTAVDRNVWGVTFESDDKFYATAASGGKTWLMHGSISNRSMTSVLENAECPSISPQRDKVAYKKRSTKLGIVHWDIAVLDLKSMEEIVIPLDEGYDDQIEWLDDQTMIFGLPRAGTVGDSDIYSIKTDAKALPELFIEHAWSPSVQHGN